MLSVAQVPEGQVRVIPEGFVKLVQACKAVEGRVKVIWSQAVAFAVAQDFKDDKIAKTVFKELEKEYGSDYKVRPNVYPAYRSAKSTIVKAIKYKISLTDSTGNPKLKNVVRDEINAAIGSPAKIDSFKRAVNTANNAADALLSEDEILSALSLVQDLRDKLQKSHKTIRKAVA